MDKKNVLHWMKYTIILAMVSSLFIINGCGGDDESSSFKPITVEGNLLTLIDQPEFKQSEGAPASRALDSLAKYLDLYGLEALVSTTNNITVFAPSNQAFVNLLTTTPGFPSNIRSISPSLIQGVLAYHVAVELIERADMTSGAEFETFFEQPNNCDPEADGVVQVIEVNSDRTLFTGSSNPKIKVTLADNKASNGNLHIVGSVMIPPSVGATLTPILTKLTATVLLSSNFKILAGLMIYADCGITDPVATPPLTSILAKADGTYTVFLPTDAVFASAVIGLDADNVTEAVTALAGRGIDTKAKVRTFILNHIHAGAKLNAAAVATKTSLVMMGGATYDISGGTTPMTINGKAIVGPNADSRDNGFAHVIQGMLGL